MKYCKNCHVKYNTPIEHCLFCNRELEKCDEAMETFKYAKYKEEPQIKKSSKFLIFLLLITIPFSLFIDFATKMEKPLGWSLVVSVSCLYAIYFIVTISSEKSWIRKIISFIAAGIIEIVAVGFIINDSSWAIDFVMPSAFSFNLLFLSVVLFIKKRKWYDYSTYLFVMSLFGTIPFILFLCGVTKTSWPSIGCFILSILTFLGTWYFSSKATKEELSRRFHI